MIGRIHGTLLEKTPPELLVDVNGVGYEIQAPMSVFYHLPQVGESVTLITQLIIRDDAHILFGFGSMDERQLFRDLIKVNGVGPKMALTILSGMDASEFIQTVVEDDVKRMTLLPGVGKRTAERLILEMKPKMKEWEARLPESSLPLGDIPSVSAHDAVQDAENALIALGYKPQEATKAVSAVKGEGISTEEMIRLALQSSVKK